MVATVILDKSSLFLEALKYQPPPGLLFSYVDISTKEGDLAGWFKRYLPAIDKIIGLGGEVMLDSGAFGAHKRGQIINVGDYVRFIKDFYPLFTLVVGLDVIYDWRATANNIRVMEDAGISDITYVLPTYHVGSPIDALLTYYESGYDWIGLGGIARLIKSGARASFFDRVLAENLDVKYHVFGVGDFALLSKYPCYSFDSATWGIMAGNGNIIHPDTGVALWVTRGHHKMISNGLLERIERAALEFGLTLPMLFNDRESRYIYNYQISMKFVKNLKIEKSPRRQFIF